jgi:ferredoxin-NADP reductase
VTDAATATPTASPRTGLVAPLAHLAWREAMVAAVVDETADARSLVLDVPHWPGHVAGQHVDVRLTAPDGYQATRSYSLSSGPGEEPTITVQEVEDGEVSTYLVRDIAVGDTLGVRGPIGGYFVWAGQHRPLLLVGGGSGLAPLRAMWRAADPTAPVVVLASVTTPARLLYATELADRVRSGTASATVHLSRSDVPPDAVRTGSPLAAVTLRPGRVDAASVEAAVVACGGAQADPAVFVCGPTSFVEALVDLLGAAGLDPRTVRAERFG